MYSIFRRTDQSAAGLVTRVRKLLVLSASLRIFARRVFWCAVSICIFLRSSLGSVLSSLLHHKIGHIGPEGICDQRVGNLAVLDGIVKQGSNDQIRILTRRRFGDQRGELEKMVDVGLLGRTLAALVDVPSRGRIGGLQDGDPLFH
jgi:hypothetical protein